VNSIYRDTARWTEQESPTVILLSDPTVPDRTECLLNGKHEILLQRLTSSVETLLAMGATRIIVCCLTIHPLIHQMPPALRKKIVSLVDLTLGAVQRSRSRHLLLYHWDKGCGYSGNIGSGINETKVVLPDDHDQDAIHQMLYEIKNQREAVRTFRSWKELMKKYECALTSLVALKCILQRSARANLADDRREFNMTLLRVLPMMQRNVLTSAGHAG
jgi:aspartate racemase